MAKFGFDTSDIDPTEGPSYELLPEGEYTLMCLEAEEKETSTGGTMINAKYQVVGGKHDGRWVWQNYNIVNKSEAAQRIGRQQLVAWATACGKPEADDTDKLLNKRFNCIIGIRKGTNGYKDQNEIKQFLFSDDAVSSKKASEPEKKASSPSEEKKPDTSSSKSKGGNPWD